MNYLTPNSQPLTGHIQDQVIIVIIRFIYIYIYIVNVSLWYRQTARDCNALLNPSSNILEIYKYIYIS